MYGYINGNIVLEENMRISPRDIGILRGYAVFDAIAVFHKEPFLAQEHWDQFNRSAQALALSLPISFEEWVDIIKKLTQENNLEKASVRTILTGGVSENAFDPNFNQPTLFMLMDTWKELPKEWYDRGIRIITKPYIRRFPYAKTVDYVFPISYLAEKKEREAVEILYIQEGKILEASTSNICIVSNGTIITPASNVFGGITRKYVLRLAEKLKIPFEERDIPVSEMFSADEVFITGSYKHILPVVYADDKKIGDGLVGEVTKELMRAFRKSVEIVG